MMLDDPHHVSANTPTKRLYRLVDLRTNEYVLLTDLERRTRNPKLAYIAIERQIDNARKRYPGLRGLHAERVKF